MQPMRKQIYGANIFPYPVPLNIVVSVKNNWSLRYPRILKFLTSISIIVQQLPYRTKIRRTKLSEFLLGVENFVQYLNTKVRQKSDIIVEILDWCRKFCPTKFFPIT